ncbi:MAG: hypothetical protein QGH80_01725 [Acidimicrobiales bacterium]|jgi:hypothetical protein|nr:hypothetical protein [Acidimicrobiales bacterium]
MAIFVLIGALAFGALFLLLWKKASVVKSEVEKTVRELDNASVVLGGIAREVERAEVHLARLTRLRIRRLVASRIFSRPRRRLLRRRRT